MRKKMTVEEKIDSIKRKIKILNLKLQMLELEKPVTPKTEK